MRNGRSKECKEDSLEMIITLTNLIQKIVDLCKEAGMSVQKQHLQAVVSEYKNTRKTRRHLITSQMDFTCRKCGFLLLKFEKLIARLPFCGHFLCSNCVMGELRCPCGGITRGRRYLLPKVAKNIFFDAYLDNIIATKNWLDGEKGPNVVS